MARNVEEYMLFNKNIRNKCMRNKYEWLNEKICIDRKTVEQRRSKHPLYKKHQSEKYAFQQKV